MNPRNRADTSQRVGTSAITGPNPNATAVETVQAFRLRSEGRIPLRTHEDPQVVDCPFGDDLAIIGGQCAVHSNSDFLSRRTRLAGAGVHEAPTRHRIDVVFPHAEARLPSQPGG